ncbi:MAG: GWxTD domain-containing protein [bacterium]
MKYKLILVILLLSMREPAAQTLTPASPFVINLDAARFRNDQLSGYLEVYYGFYPQLLTYHHSDGKFHGGVKLHSRILKMPAREAVASKKSVFKISEADTAGAWYHYPFITQNGFVLPHGEYELEVTAEDSLGQERRAAMNLPLKIEAYAASATSSDLELCKSITASNKKDDLFFKNAHEVVPLPGLVFGATTAPVVYHYLELYNLQAAMPYRIKTLVIKDDGAVARESVKPRKFNVRHAMEMGTTNIMALPSGKYAFRMVLIDSSDQALHQTEKTFFVYNPQIQPQAGPAAPLPAFGALSGITDEQLTSEFRQAQYLATKDEVKLFGKLENAEGKREFLSKFWEEVEQGRRDFFPIRRSEYLRRVRIVNDRYGALSKDGWQTNRGRIYLLYGEPDEIERFDSQGVKPHEIWSYFSIENGVEFVFVNRFGTNDYELVHSTKRGELRDPDWRRILSGAGGF